MEKQNTRFRTIKKWGNSLVVVLNSIDIKDLGIKEGDQIDISDTFIISKELKDIKDGNHNVI